jgi:hypothetical protein
MRRRNLFWPIIIIILGGIWLLGNMNILRINIWAMILPILLIALGISILLGNSARTLTAETERLSIPLEGAEKARIRLGYGAGRVNLSSGAEPGMLLTGTFIGGVEQSTQHEGTNLSVRLDSPMMVQFPFDQLPSSREWKIGMSGQIPMSLEVHAGAAEMNLNLTDLRVTDIQIETGASSTTLLLPSQAGSTRVNIKGGAASFDIRVPEGVAARIRSESAMTDIKVNSQRFSRAGGWYESSNFASATNKVEIEIQMGVGSVTVN